MSSQFIREHSKKIFITNCVPDYLPKELLSAAAGPLSGLTNRETGHKIWKIDRPLPLEGKPRALYVFAAARYPLARAGGTVGLTLGAIPQGEAGIQVMAVLEDSMGWEIGVAEQIADVAMVAIDRGITGRFPQHGGWAMTSGAWRFGHHFAAPEGIPPDPPLPAATHGGEQPADFFYNPLTARVWGANFPGGSPQTMLGTAAGALTNQNRGWTLEFFEEVVDGAAVPGFSGHLVLPSGGVLYVNTFSQYHGSVPMLVVQFADAGYWSSQSVQEAMERTAVAVNTALQQQFGGVLKLLPPPRSG